MSISAHSFLIMCSLSWVLGCCFTSSLATFFVQTEWEGHCLERAQQARQRSAQRFCAMDKR